MTRHLATSLKALEAAVDNLKNDKAAKALKAGTNLFKLVKPGDALTAERAQKLVTFFDEELEILYSLLPQLTVNFSMLYFTDLVRVFKAEQPQQLWQHVGGKGILTGLLTFMQAQDTGFTTHFDKGFVTALCQLLNSGSSSKYFKLSTNFRRCVGSFLAAVAATDEKARKWMLETKVLGIVGLSGLIVKETEFRILDACLEIATRLAPKRSDLQARQAFFTDVFNSKSAKAAFGEEACKRLMRIVEQPVKGRTWFEIADQMLAEMGGDADRLQRFVIEHLVVSGQTFSGNEASVRMYLDTKITFHAFLLGEGEEVMITTSYDNLIEIQIDFVEGLANTQLVLKSPPNWENPNELSHTTATVITLRLSVSEMTRFQKILKLRGQAAKLVVRAKPTKQSFSLHPMQLGQSNPPAPPPLQAKAAVLKSFIPSPTPMDISRSSLTSSKISSHTDPEKPPLASSPSVPRQQQVSLNAKGMVKTIKNGVCGGVIIDSDDDLGEEPLTKPVAKSGSKRKAPESSDIDEELRSPEPARKKLHLEKLDGGTKTGSVKKGLLKYPMTQPNRQKPLALDDSGKTNKPVQGPVTATSSKPLKPTAPHNHSRINGMRTKDGTRPTAASTPLRNGLPTKTDIPRSVPEPSQRPVKETLEAKAANPLIRGANKSIAKPEKAIWEAEDFSQKAVLMFPPMGATLKEKLIIDKSIMPDPNGEAEDAVLEDEVEVIFMPDVEPVVVEDIPATPSPPKFARELDTPVQGDGLSSPIRPVMALKRKLRDADTLSQRLHAQIPPASASHVASVIKKGGNVTPDADGEQFSGPKRDDLETMGHPVPKEAAPNESRRKPETGPLRPFLPIKHSHKRRPIVDWAVPINPSRPGPITGLGNVKQPVEKSSKVSVGLKKGFRAADNEAPKHKAPRPVETTDDDSDSEAEERAVTATPKSGVDAIAEVLTAIQDTILDSIRGKFSGMRREAGLARANLLENAIVDLEVIQENHDKSFSRFMRLEEKCGEVTQDIVGTLEEVDAANQAVIANLNTIILGHDEAAAAFRAARKPLFSKPPKCLEVEGVF